MMRTMIIVLVLATASPEGSMHTVTGEFDVELTPREWDGASDVDGLARHALAKTFRGPLEGSSSGQMMSWRGAAASDGAYVAIETFTGTLDGRSGSFVLQHRGVMNAKGMALDVEIVPMSGTGELAGIHGTMTIHFDGPQHRYELEYQIESQ